MLDDITYITGALWYYVWRAIMNSIQMKQKIVKHFR